MHAYNVHGFTPYYTHNLLYTPPPSLKYVQTVRRFCPTCVLDQSGRIHLPRSLREEQTRYSDPSCKVTGFFFYL